MCPSSLATSGKVGGTVYAGSLVAVTSGKIGGIVGVCVLVL